MYYKVLNKFCREGYQVEMRTIYSSLAFSRGQTLLLGLSASEVDYPETINKEDIGVKNLRKLMRVKPATVASVDLTSFARWMSHVQ